MDRESLPQPTTEAFAKVIRQRLHTVDVEVAEDEVPKELWDSLDPLEVTLTAPPAQELDERRERLKRHGSQGRPWRETIEERKERGG